MQNHEHKWTMFTMQGYLLSIARTVHPLPSFLPELLQRMHPMRSVLQTGQWSLHRPQLPDHQPHHQLLPDLLHQLSDQPQRGLQVCRSELQNHQFSWRLPLVFERLLFEK